MCLYTKSKKPETAPKDIKVYKVMHVAKTKELNGETVTYGVPPYFSGYIYVKGLNKPRTESKPAKETTDSRYYFVEEGYLHAFKDWFHAAKRVACLKYENPFDDFYIVEMYIPAGTTYYVGDDGDIAASALYWPVEDKNT